MEIKEYNNGSVERSYVATQAMEVSSSAQRDQFAVLFKLYYTIKSESENLVTSKFTFRVDKVTTSITKVGLSSTNITKIIQNYHIPTNIDKSQTYYYSNSSSIGSTQTFTLYSSHSGFYTADEEGFLSKNAVYGQTVVSFTSGTDVVLHRAAYVPSGS